MPIFKRDGCQLEREERKRSKQHENRRTKGHDPPETKTCRGTEGGGGLLIHAGTAHAIELMIHCCQNTFFGWCAKRTQLCVAAALHPCKMCVRP